MFRSILTLAALSSLLALVSNVRAEPACTPVPIPSLGGDFTWAQGINDWGQVVGRSLTGDFGEPSRGYVFERGVTRALPDLVENGSSDAQAINDFGLIVGGASDERSRFVPVTWQRDRIALLPGDLQGVAIDVNNRGQIVGTTGDACLLWENRWSDPIQIGLGGPWCEVTEISDHGVVIGSGTLPTVPPGRGHGFIFRNGVSTDVHTLPGWPADFVQSSLYDIDDSGTVYGVGGDGFSQFTSFFLTPSGTVHRLDRSYIAIDVMRFGTIVTREVTPTVAEVSLISLLGRIYPLGQLESEHGVGAIVANDRLQFAYAARTGTTEAWFCDLTD